MKYLRFLKGIKSNAANTYVPMYHTTHVHSLSLHPPQVVIATLNLVFHCKCFSIFFFFLLYEYIPKQYMYLIL